MVLMLHLYSNDVSEWLNLFFDIFYLYLILFWYWLHCMCMHVYVMSHWVGPCSTLISSPQIKKQSLPLCDLQRTEFPMLCLLSCLRICYMHCRKNGECVPRLTQLKPGWQTGWECVLYTCWSRWYLRQQTTGHTLPVPPSTTSVAKLAYRPWTCSVAESSLSTPSLGGYTIHHWSEDWELLKTLVLYLQYLCLNFQRLFQETVVIRLKGWPLIITFIVFCFRGQQNLRINQVYLITSSWCKVLNILVFRS